MKEIFITSYKPRKRTLECIASVIKTVSQPYCLTIIGTAGSAAENKNIALDLSRTGTPILLDDDIIFYQPGWDDMLLESLDSSGDISIVGCKVNFTGREFSLGYKAQKNSLINNIRVLGCVMAIMDTGIRYDEEYIKSQGDDIDFMLQNVEAGYRVLCDTRVEVYHPAIITCASKHKTQNSLLAFKKWGRDYYLSWGRLPSEFIVEKKY